MQKFLGLKFGAARSALTVSFINLSKIFEISFLGKYFFYLSTEMVLKNTPNNYA